MTKHYTHGNVRENAHIWIPITISTDGESLAVLVVNVINQFNLWSKRVGITSDGGTNQANARKFKRVLFTTWECLAWKSLFL